MAAIRAASTSLTLLASTSSSSSCYYHSCPSIFTKFRFGPIRAVSLTFPPLSSRRAKRMAHSIARATLGLTQPNKIDSPKISFAAKEIDLGEWKGDILAVGVTEKDLAKDENSKFKNASCLGSKRVGLIGLGSAASATVTYRSLGEAVAAAAKSTQASNVAITLASSEGIPAELKPSTASAIASGAVLGTFDDNRFRSESKQPSLKSVEILGLGALASEAQKIASEYSDVFSAKILDEEQCKELKMGSYLGVAAASANPPHFIHLCYKPPSGEVKTKLALVGKGLTFDSGGYNIKTGPGCSIELMKFDMGGSAAVLGAAKALGQIKPAGVEVHFIVAACENMISGTGMRPGDIVTASNGKTIEVNNTDAEGRLTLADALVYACNQGVEKIVDLATLTGACVVALGPSIGGVFTPSDDLAKEVLGASEASGEKLWRMPLEESYWDSMKSGVADMVNTGGRQGGAITAALFLKQFVDEKVQWMHIDIAGPVWNDKKKNATGFGISTLVEWVLKNSS
ncbi:Leucine aminopeptidase 2, chloroplastic [Sesamum angolense]|uniref:Leucine aminopeptidase 2, chloroplastic n=1 Tax=Sesamum angolense TaxID=2727404 RepID=A0AAE2BPF5_9LAMI|nr:Leucine aminopeptidase 2, chloroplastic [Sesamum angolense]